MLRRGAGADIKIADDLQAGAKGEIVLESKNKSSIRKDGPSKGPKIGGLTAIKERLEEADFDGDLGI